MKNLSNKKSKLIIHMRYLCTKNKNLPLKKDFFLWISTVCHAVSFIKRIEITILIVEKKKILFLNRTFRKQNKLTNILTFPFQLPPEIKSPYLGDIVICKPIIEKESKITNISLKAYWAHIVIHGVLHLFGYNHILQEEALKMEKLENFFLKKLGYNNFYL